MMPMTFRASAVIALSAMFLVACGGSGSADGGSTAGASKGCTERDGGWFGRSEDGAMITSQTKAACEKRLGG